MQQYANDAQTVQNQARQALANQITNFGQFDQTQLSQAPNTLNTEYQNEMKMTPQQILAQQGISINPSAQGINNISQFIHAAPSGQGYIAPTAQNVLNSQQQAYINALNTLAGGSSSGTVNPLASGILSQLANGTAAGQYSSQPGYYFDKNGFMQSITLPKPNTPSGSGEGGGGIPGNSGGMPSSGSWTGDISGSLPDGGSGKLGALS
jgi:hypothetical protein